MRESVASYGELYEETETVIESGNLSPIEHLLLLSLLDDAINQEEACRFILDQVSKGTHTNTSAEDVLRGIKQDLTMLAKKCCLGDDNISADLQATLSRRQETRCYMSGSHANLKPTYIISPSILDDEDLKPGGRLRPLFEAVISAEIAGKILAYLDSCKDEADRLKNLWLMSPPVQAAFRRGHVVVFKSSFRDVWSIRRRMPQAPQIAGLHEDFNTEPSTPDKTVLPLPEGFLLDAHRAISLPLHFLPIEQDIRGGWPPADKDRRQFGTLGRYLLRTFFSIIPTFLCIMLYELILKGIDRWNPQDNPGFKVLPLGLCLKTGRRVSENEANALLLAEKHTTIPSPRLINLALDKKGERGYLLMTTVPGVPAEQVFYRMTYEERHQMARDLGEWIAQYRRIPNRNKHLFCNTIGGPLLDHRTGSTKPCGPYNSKTDFLDHLIDEEIRKERPISILYEKEHQVCFTHSDLHLSNLMVEEGRLCGLIDWEHAGFRPEYWEYTKSLWPYMGQKKFTYMFSLAFNKNYEDELEGELELWRLYPTF